MSRRISIPDEHVAVILPNQLADELQSIMLIWRQRANTILARKDADEESKQMARRDAAIIGDGILAILEAREA